MLEEAAIDDTDIAAEGITVHNDVEETRVRMLRFSSDTEACVERRTRRISKGCILAVQSRGSVCRQDLRETIQWLISH
jgi:hypothetical protein